MNIQLDKTGNSKINCEILPKLNETFLFDLVYDRLYESAAPAFRGYIKYPSISQLNNFLVDELNNNPNPLKDKQLLIKSTIKSFSAKYNSYIKKAKDTIKHNGYIFYDDFAELSLAYKHYHLNLINTNISQFVHNDNEGYIGKGCLIMTKLNGKSTFTPLILTTVYNENIPYIINSILLNKPINPLALNVYISDLIVNSKDLEFKRLRINLKKYVLADLLKYNIEIADLTDLFMKIDSRFTTFRSIKDRKLFLKDLSDDVLNSLQQEVRVVY